MNSETFIELREVSEDYRVPTLDLVPPTPPPPTLPIITAMILSSNSFKIGSDQDLTTWSYLVENQTTDDLGNIIWNGGDSGTGATNGSVFTYTDGSAYVRVLFSKGGLAAYSPTILMTPPI